MPDNLEDHSDTNDTPITVNALIKWGSIFLGCMTAVISGVWFAAGIQASVAEIKIEQHSIRDSFNVKKESDEKRFTVDEARSDHSDQNIQQMQLQLDVAVALLQRIDSKVGKP